MDQHYTLVLGSFWQKFILHQEMEKSTRKFLAMRTFVTKMFHGINPGHGTKRSNWTGLAPCLRYFVLGV